MTVRVEFFFDLSSPWTWLAFRNIQPVIAEAGARVRWRPSLVGGVFNAVNQQVCVQSRPHSSLRHRLQSPWRDDLSEGCHGNAGIRGNRT